MANPILGGITLTGCNNIHVEKNANIIPIPIPTEDADKTEVFDMLGVVKLLSLRGTFAGSTIADAKAKVDAIEALITGNQTTITFESDQTGTGINAISCMVASITVDWNIPGYSCTYDIKLIQGTPA